MSLKQQRPQLIRPASERGVNWSAERVVLAKIGSKELWWHRGGKFYANRMSGTKYARTELLLVEWTKARFHTGYPLQTTLEEGGRLSAAKIGRHAEAIDDFFDGMPVSEAIALDATVVIGEQIEEVRDGEASSSS